MLNVRNINNHSEYESFWTWNVVKIPKKKLNRIKRHVKVWRKFMLPNANVVFQPLPYAWSKMLFNLNVYVKVEERKGVKKGRFLRYVYVVNKRSLMYFRSFFNSIHLDPFIWRHSAFLKIGLVILWASNNKV